MSDPILELLKESHQQLQLIEDEIDNREALQLNCLELHAQLDHTLRQRTGEMDNLFQAIGLFQRELASRAFDIEFALADFGMANDLRDRLEPNIILEHDGETIRIVLLDAPICLYRWNYPDEPVLDDSVMLRIPVRAMRSDAQIWDLYIQFSAAIHIDADTKKGHFYPISAMRLLNFDLGRSTVLDFIPIEERPVAHGKLFNRIIDQLATNPFPLDDWALPVLPKSPRVFGYLIESEARIVSRGLPKSFTQRNFTRHPLIAYGHRIRVDKEHLIPILENAFREEGATMSDPRFLDGHVTCKATRGWHKEIEVPILPDIDVYVTIVVEYSIYFKHEYYPKRHPSGFYLYPTRYHIYVRVEDAPTSGVADKIANAVLSEVSQKAAKEIIPITTRFAPPFPVGSITRAMAQFQPFGVLIALSR